MTRQATESSDDPMQYVTEVLVKPDFCAKVDLNGSTVFAVGRRGAG